MKSYTLSWALVALVVVVVSALSAPYAWSFVDATADESESATPSVLIRAHRMTSEETARNAGIVGRHSRRFSEVEINPDVLLNFTGNDNDKPVSVRVHSTVELEPFPGEKYVARGMYVEQWNDSVWSWVGSIDGYDNAETVLTFAERSVYGVIRVGPIMYEIQSGQDGRVYVRDPDLVAYGFESACALEVPGDGSGAERLMPVSQEPHSKEKPMMSDAKSVQSDPVIDLLFLYSEAAANRYDIEVLANNSVAIMNTSFINSGVNAAVRIVHYAEVENYSKPSPMDEDEIKLTVVHMANGTGEFSGIPDLRDDHAADLVMFIWDGSKAEETCGAAFIVGKHGDDTKFTANTGDECIGMFNNFAHEIGHNLGGDHDYPGLLQIIAFEHSHGYTHGSPEFRTIMGSQGACSDSACDRLNRWSDPSSQHNGINMGEVGKSHMVDSNNEMAGVVAAYRTPSGSAPGTIGSLTVTRLLCFDQNLIEWTTPTGLMGWYEVQTSTSSGFGSPQLIYRGNAAEAMPVSAFTETWVRVRSCNGVGCSGWTNGDKSATYTPGCM